MGGFQADLAGSLRSLKIYDTQFYLRNEDMERIFRA